MARFAKLSYWLVLTLLVITMLVALSNCIGEEDDVEEDVEDFDEDVEDLERKRSVSVFLYAIELIQLP